MGLVKLLRGVFGSEDASRPASMPASYVRSWVKQHASEGIRGGKLTLDALFVEMMAAATHVAEVDRAPDELARTTFLEYAGDPCLFETCCYLYFRLDLWLFDNRPQLRDAVTDQIGDRFESLFRHALNLENISAIIDERLGYYGEIARKSGDPARYHFLLMRYLQWTAGNVIPKPREIAREPWLVGGFIEDALMKAHLAAFEIHLMPAFFSLVEAFANRVAAG